MNDDLYTTTVRELPLNAVGFLVRVYSDDPQYTAPNEGILALVPVDNRPYLNFCGFQWDVNGITLRPDDVVEVL